eukprot:9448218-Pyramimonas_sp.AAC.1
MDMLDHLEEQLSWDTRSTAYSGIGAPEVAINCICQALGRKKKKIIHPPRFLYAIEWDEDAQKELQILLAPTGGCLFGDITQFFIPELQDQVNALLEDPQHAYKACSNRDR